jgi:Domain of unknown function (DUF4331)
MSHHFDSPTAVEDGRLNLLDVYVFPEAAGTTTLVVGVNPDSGRSSPTTFRPDALYEFVIASDGGPVEDRAFLMSFGEPDADGHQEMRVRYAVGGPSQSGLYGHGPQRQVSRAANPMLRSLFFPRPGADTEALNAGSPAGDAATFGEAVRRTAAHVARLSRIPRPDEHAATVAAAFLPDVLRYRPGQAARFAPGTGNGRGLHDDAFGTTLSLLVGGQLGVTASPNPVVPEFPHLAPPGHEDIPALADLLGLRGHDTQQPPS